MLHDKIPARKKAWNGMECIQLWGQWSVYNINIWVEHLLDLLLFPPAVAGNPVESVLMAERLGSRQQTSETYNSLSLSLGHF